MSGGKRPLVAFYAPMKAPDHPVPSGDRTVARLYVRALEQAGFQVEIASDLRVFDAKGDVFVQAGFHAAAAAEIRRLNHEWDSGRCRPDLWFTYHVYHKSPDLIGQSVSSSIGIPYVISEPSYAPKRRNGGWSSFFIAAERAISSADRLFVSTAADAVCVGPVARLGALVRLPPFIDTDGWSEPGPRVVRAGPCRLVTVAMMRHGDKFSSFVLLAKYLENIINLDWTLEIIGDGPARYEVEKLFRAFGNRVTFTGMIGDRAAMAGTLGAADLFIWPAVNEAFGMAMLEAALMGLPVMAGDEGGVSEVVLREKTGFLARNDDFEQFCRLLKKLVLNPALRNEMGAAARRFVLAERSLDSAALVLRNSLFPLIKT